MEPDLSVYSNSKRPEGPLESTRHVVTWYTPPSSLACSCPQWPGSAGSRLVGWGAFRGQFLLPFKLLRPPIIPQWFSYTLFFLSDAFPCILSFPGWGSCGSQSGIGGDPFRTGQRMRETGKGHITKTQVVSGVGWGGRGGYRLGITLLT